MEHIPIEHKAGECGSEGGCFICDGGLFLCKNCGCLEGGLASECPNYRISYDDEQSIYKGEIDFIGGRWVGGHRNFGMSHIDA